MGERPKGTNKLLRIDCKSLKCFPGVDWFGNLKRRKSKIINTSDKKKSARLNAD